VGGERRKQLNAKLCAPGGYPGALITQDGSVFANAGQCTSYTAKGAQLVGVNASAQPIGSILNFQYFRETCTGFGLKPVGAGCGVAFAGGPAVVFPPLPPATDDTISISGVYSCSSSNEVVYLFVQADTAQGTPFERRFPAPSGC
jgi:hypothetical protein